MWLSCDYHVTQYNDTEDNNAAYIHTYVHDKEQTKRGSKLLTIVYHPSYCHPHTSSHSLLTLPPHTPSSHSLLTLPPQIPSTHSLLTFPPHNLSSHSLLTLPPHIPFSHSLLTFPPHTPSSHSLLTLPPHIPSSNSLLPPHTPLSMRRFTSSANQLSVLGGRGGV